MRLDSLKKHRFGRPLNTKMPPTTGETVLAKWGFIDRVDRSAALNVSAKWGFMFRSSGLLSAILLDRGPIHGARTSYVLVKWELLDIRGSIILKKKVNMRRNSLKKHRFGGR